ncbi:hypothetical protein [Cohnella phaseoli]|uniref:Uncharacterized protein n=1 Tax=Cohnella phaseoli TaxID=456490 RepID=A0A3D9KEQ8_9BACL|nr:hypothetical protein [Cohnella phaseoli]RED84006.1 hypothetical protein DFP98_107114 [Cohnella phaseoli]
MKKRNLLLFFALALGICLTSITAAAAINFDPGGVDDIPPLALDASDEEMIQHKQMLMEKLKKELKFEPLSGDETLGKEIMISEKLVKLPPDTKLEGIIISDHGYNSDDLPAYKISRGDSLIKVSIATGKILDEHLDPSAKGQSPFSFLDAFTFSEK